LQHPRHIGARQADARHHIELEKSHPLAVGDVEEVMRAIDADIVDENGARGLGLYQRLATSWPADHHADALCSLPGQACPNAGEGSFFHADPGSALLAV